MPQVCKPPTLNRLKGHSKISQANHSDTLDSRGCWVLQLLQAVHSQPFKNIHDSGPGWVAHWVRALSRLHQGCGFNPQSGHIRESTNECINKWNNKLISASLSSQFFKKEKIPMPFCDLNKLLVIKNLPWETNHELTFCDLK